MICAMRAQVLRRMETDQSLSSAGKPQPPLFDGRYFFDLSPGVEKRRAVGRCAVLDCAGLAGAYEPP